jgi:outer membrane protein OmpA-like peptidoglycan-associated protein
VIAGLAAILCAFWLFPRPQPVTVGIVDIQADRPVGTSGVLSPAPAYLRSSYNITVRPGAPVSFDLDQVLFNSGSATLRPQSMPQLREAARLLEANPGVSATISGYTDNIGDAAMNLKLSQERATSVMKALEGMGVPASRLDATGYGEEHPVADNATASGRALNRRTTMDVTQQ